MHRVSVESATIRSVGYDQKTSTLEIEFSNGNIYQYFDVPETVHSELMRADSLGRFFGAQIRGNYRYARFDAEA